MVLHEYYLDNCKNLVFHHLLQLGRKYKELESLAGRTIVLQNVVVELRCGKDLL